MIKNAILLAGGTGSRLLPFTSYVSKHLLDVGGKPIIDYPIHTLQQMGIENVVIVVGSSFSGQILDYIRDGSRYGLNVQFSYQQKPRGIAQAINICQRYVSSEEQFVVILGDNIYGCPIRWNEDHLHQAQVVLWKVDDLQRFGVASIDRKTDEIVKIEEKPKTLNHKYDQYAITGCYLFDQRFFSFFKETKPSVRGEFEIVDILNAYHQCGMLYPTFNASHLDVNGAAFWSDAGTHESIAHCNQYFYQHPTNW